MSPPTATLLAAAIAAVAAVGGYLSAQRWKRRDDKVRLFADALQAVRRYEELPFRISRRPDSSPATRERMAGLVSDSFIELGHYRALLLLHSREAGDAYALLLNRTHRDCRPHRQQAWSMRLVRQDSDAHMGGKFLFDNKPELALCVVAMRRSLRPFAVLRGRRTRREIRALIAARELDPTMPMELTTRLRAISRELSSLRPPPPRS
ncbi:hypothetical protein [Actinoplanes solisilvae]|uniref:hypothetical protein n=1 Tax=Actinoplanes solisilvae TaxID=2486853 RepID=UPI000FD78F07|nr:hypothetical protein [Actinoplanes solisilvae]